jgi:outer membrane protein
MKKPETYNALRTRAHTLYILSVTIYLLLSIALPSACFAQKTFTVTLNDAIGLAEKQSPDAILAKTKYQGSYWRYRYYRATYLPSLSLAATLPSITRSYTQIVLPNGSEQFIQQSLSSSSVNLSLMQQIGLTGGSVFLNSGLQRIDLFTDHTTSYLSTPISIGINQPILTYNDLKWQKIIEPLYFKEARRQYVQDLEDIHIKTVALFFDVLTSQSNIQSALLDKANSDTLYKLGQGRFGLGRIAENELLQLELNTLNSGLSVQQNTISYNAALAKMKSYLGLNARDSLILMLPPTPDSNMVNIAFAASQASNNNPVSVTLERQEREAERDVAKARGNNGIQGSLFGEYGLNQNAPTIKGAYQNPQDQEQLRFGITLPIIDWGRAHGAIEMAKAQQQLALTNIKKTKTDFDQEVELIAAEYNLQNNQLLTARKADEVSKRRFFIAKQRYLLGKIGITDLNIAQTDRDAAQRSLIDVLRNSWNNYYNLRKITLYDFKKQMTLEQEVTDVF